MLVHKVQYCAVRGTNARGTGTGHHVQQPLPHSRRRYRGRPGCTGPGTSPYPPTPCPVLSYALPTPSLVPSYALPKPCPGLT